MDFNSENQIVLLPAEIQAGIEGMQEFCLTAWELSDIPLNKIRMDQARIMAKKLPPMMFWGWMLRRLRMHATGETWYRESFKWDHCAWTQKGINERLLTIAFAMTRPGDM